MGAELSRRGFLGSAGVAAVASAQSSKPTAANDRITVGMIGVGSRGQELLEAIKKVDGTEIVAVCDAYKGRLDRAVSRTEGRAKRCRDHHDILADSRIDAVVVASPDHWHKQQVIECLDAGKDVYCEKPLTYAVDEGHEIAAAVKRSGRLLQVGAQGISARVQQKARELVQSGKLGDVTMIRAGYNRQHRRRRVVVSVSSRRLSQDGGLGYVRRRRDQAAVRPGCVSSAGVAIVSTRAASRPICSSI